MERTIGTSDVKAFLNVAPPGILVDLKMIIDKRLNAIADEDSRRNMMRRVEGRMPLDEDSGDNPSIAPDLAEISDARAQLAAFSSGASSVEADLRSQLARQQKIDDMALGDMDNVKLIFKYADKYDDGCCEVVDPEVKKKLEVQLAKCKTEGLKFPYGFGRNNDLLKIKKFNRAEPGQNLNVSLKFSKWNFNGTSGFSCYVK